MYVRAMLIMSILRELHTKPVYIFLAYTQADVKSDIFMEIFIRFGFEGSRLREWVIIFDKNIYGLKDAGMSWFEKTKEGLESRGFVCTSK